MGITLRAFVEYDDSPTYCAAASKRPFETQTDRVIDLTTNVGLSHGKDMLFMHALGHGRLEKDDLDLPSVLRGLPPNVNWRIARELADTPGVSWLNGTELALVVSRVVPDVNKLSFAAQLTLSIMRFLSDRLGPERVRLVYSIEA